MKRFLFLLLLGVAGAALVRLFIVEGIYLASDSMAPTLKTNDHVLVNKCAFFLRAPRRGEVVLLRTPQRSKDLVKRVIAIGGDVVEIRKKQVFLNGQKLNEPYVQFVKPDTLFTGDDIAPLKIPDGFVFVMGDNRDVSGDSRDWKNEEGEWRPYVPLSAVLGSVIMN